MNFPQLWRLRRPLYRFAEGQVYQDKLRGLRKFKPVQFSSVRSPHCLFVFMEQDRELANKLYLALRNGVGTFPGCAVLTGIHLEKTQAEKLLVRSRPGGQAREHFETIARRLQGEGPTVDFGFVIQSREADPRDDPYGASKAAFLQAGVASQYVSYELLGAEQQFRFAMTNIALSFFVKLGGVPWSVVPSRKATSLVIGIGRAETRTTTGNVQFTGFAISVLSDGQYIATDYFPPARSYSEFLTVLQPALTDALTSLLERKSLERLTIHVTRFEKSDLVRVVTQAVESAQDRRGIYVPFEVVRVSPDSEFMVLDLAHPGYVSAEGTVVSLRPSKVLLVTEGREEKAVWHGRKPVSVELTREFRSEGAVDFRDSIADAFALSSVNWRGFNAITQPVSIQYAHLLAEQVAKVASFDPQLAGTAIQSDKLRGIPWFI
jgi:hypothetical protein